MVQYPVVVVIFAALVSGCGGSGGDTPGGGGGHAAGSSSSSVGGGGGGQGGGPYAGPPLPWEYVAFPEVVAPKDNPTTEAKVDLGALLFYDPILASDDEVACATCHSQDWGMGDGLALSVGVEGVGPVGPGRKGPNMTTRNSQSLWNAAFRSELFWDGRASSLELQALQPMKHHNEMDQPAATAATRIAKVAGYRKLFAAAFPGEAEAVTATQVTRALAAFERTLITDDGPYDQYVAGDAGAMAADEIRGMKVFAASNCASCHAPPLFESARYVRRLATDDPGRFDVTGDARDQGAFRVPTLRNLRDTTPYFHDGSVVKLEDAIRAELDREVSAGRASALSDADFEDLVSFLHSSLEDTSRDPTRPKSVPSGLPVPLDGDQIQR